MKRIGVVAVAAAVVLSTVLLLRRGHEGSTGWRFVAVERGDVEQVVSATGTLTPVTTVEVGTQVSGQVAELFADFNDHVTRGQLLARIDPTLLRQAVREAEANLERARADVEQKTREFERTRDLHARQGVTDSEYDAAEYALRIARSSATSAEVSLERARNNLSYTEIYSPIDGIVIQRNVDVGQTVAASLSAPLLFRIAADLTQMEILADVDESDIGVIATGQPVRFTVQAYQDRTFEGAVRQVRLQSSTQENVVNYTVVVSVPNPDGRLLPGMTATVEFLTARVEGVLRVANAALRFQPPEAMLTGFRERMRAEMAERMAAGGEPGATPAGRGNVLEPGAARGPGDGTPSDANRPGPAGGTTGRGVGSRLWALDSAGELTMVRVRPGISDGQYTEVSGPRLEEGMQVIAGIVPGGAAERSANPFQQATGGPGGPPRGPPGGF